MPRIKTAPSAVTAARKPTHYHLILRPVLQRRFARSSLWTFVVCYAFSYLVGGSHGKSLLSASEQSDTSLAFGMLFPWSVTSMRAVVLFVTLFPVLILRKADLHGEFQSSTIATNAWCSAISPSYYIILRYFKGDRFP